MASARLTQDWHIHPEQLLLVVVVVLLLLRCLQAGEGVSQGLRDSIAAVKKASWKLLSSNKTSR
jgi:hypothetical protein